MYKSLCFIACLFLVSCSTTTYYIVRHAEKETATTMTSDVPLSVAGKERAIALKDMLKDKHIRYIFSTNYNRTLSTVEPLRQADGLTIRLYDVKDTMDRFIYMLKNIKDGNVLIVGHANTVDDIVNNLTGETALPGDLPDSEYGDLFIIKKTGSHYSVEKSHYGK